MAARLICAIILMGILPISSALSVERDPHLKALACERDHVSMEDCQRFEADHVIPLCAGGPDVLDNIQLQPWVEARRKDRVEKAMCSAIRDGVMSQQGVYDYFAVHGREAW